KVNEGVLTFWTPKLTSWILTLSSQFEVKPTLPKGIRLWEEWSVLSKDPVDPATIGMIDELVVWAEGEGDPIETDGKRLGVLRPGPLYPISSPTEVAKVWETEIASGKSFERVHELCDQFLHWGRFTLRSLRVRQTFEWEGNYPSFILFRERFESRV